MVVSYLHFVLVVHTEPLVLASDWLADCKCWAAMSNQSPCKLFDLVVADRTEFVETVDIVVVGIAGLVAADIDIAAVDTSFDHYHSLVVDCIDMDAFYHSEIGHFDYDIGFDIVDIDFVVFCFGVIFIYIYEKGKSVKNNICGFFLGGFCVIFGN